jgi:Tfp pilus assembly protein PilV
MATALVRSPSTQPVRSPSTSTDERGFTLVEAVVATLIVTVGLVSMAEMMAITLRMQMLGRNQTQAVRLAQDKMDELMSKNFDSAAEIQVSESNTLDSNITNYFDTPASGYTRRWYVQDGPTDVASGGSGELRLLTVRVIHDLDDRRTSAPVELTTIIRRW